MQDYAESNAVKVELRLRNDCMRRSMSWPLIAYLLLFVVIGVGALVDDWQSRRSLVFQLAMLFTLGVGILSVLTFGLPELGKVVGRWLWPMLAFALVMETWSLVADVRDSSAEQKSSQMATTITVLIVVALTIPAYVLGAIAAARSAE